VLDGQTLETVKVDPAGYDAALIPRSPVAFLKALWVALVATFTTKKDPRPPLRLTHRWVDGFSPGTMLPLRLSSGSKQLLNARAPVAPPSTACLRGPRPRHAPGQSRRSSRSGARTALDRPPAPLPQGREPQDGNYVSSFFVDVTPTATSTRCSPSSTPAPKAWIQRFTDRKLFLVGWFNEISMWMGRKQFSRLGLWAKNHDRCPR